MKKSLGLFFLCLSLCTQVFSAPKSDYWAVWDKSDDKNAQTIDHAIWQQLLSVYLVDTPNGQYRLFRYKQVTSNDKTRLKDYIASLTRIDPRRYARAEQKAYWINLYNALTIHLVLSKYPVPSITKLGPWYAFGPWDQTITAVAGESLTLNDIEHRILRPLWDDNRIHYALNCASKGCPDLSQQAFTARNTEEQLDKLATRFVNQSKGLRIDGRTLTLSKIYDWYASDFGGNRQGLLRHLMTYADAEKKRQLEWATGKITYQYDWDLNEAL